MPIKKEKTKKEEQALAYSATMTTAAAAKKAGIPYLRLRYLMKKHKQQKGTKYYWSKEQDAMLKSMHGSSSRKQMVAALGKTKDAIGNRITLLKSKGIFK